MLAIVVRHKSKAVGDDIRLGDRVKFRADNDKHFHGVGELYYPHPLTFETLTFRLNRTSHILLDLLISRTSAYLNTSIILRVRPVPVTHACACAFACICPSVHALALFAVIISSIASLRFRRTGMNRALPCLCLLPYVRDARARCNRSWARSAE